MRSRINQELRLSGFLDVGPSPGFLIPAFTDDRSLFLQVTDDSDTIAAVAELSRTAEKQIRPLRLEGMDEGRRCAIGAPALYGFQPEAGLAWLGSRSALAARLHAWPRRHDVEPMLNLELVEFEGGSSSELRRAVARCERLLNSRGVGQASDWAEDQRRRLSLPRDEKTRDGTFGNHLLEPSDEPLLLLVHLTQLVGLQEILKDGAIRSRPSSVFQKNLAYFYYGRPSYKQETGSPSFFSAPVAIVLPVDNLPASAKLYPFDTGSIRRYWQDQRRDELRLSDFECPWSRDAPRDLVRTLFGSNKAYLMGDVRKLRRLRFSEPSRFDFIHFAVPEGGVPAFEVQTSTDVPIRGATFILPRQALDDPSLREGLRAVEAEVIAYDLSAGRGDSTQETLQRAIRDIHFERGLIDSDEYSSDEFGRPERDGEEFG